MQNIKFFNAGSIHDVPIGKAKRHSCQGGAYAVFRETFGHFYVFEDKLPQPTCPLSTGIIERDKIKLKDGHTVDLRTGRFDNSDLFVRSCNSWVENGFILFTISQIATGMV